MTVDRECGRIERCLDYLNFLNLHALLDFLKSLQREREIESF